MSNITKQTCDHCGSQIETYHVRSIAFLAHAPGSIVFHVWNSDLANEPHALHFCRNYHATLYLEKWLTEQRAPEPDEVNPASLEPVLEPIASPAEQDDGPAF